MQIQFDAAHTELANQSLWLCLRVTNRAMARRMALETQEGTLYDAEIKRHRERRSRDANAYFWELCGKLAAVIGVHKDELYRDLVRGIGDNFRLVDVARGDEDMFQRLWQSRGLGWVCEQAGEKGDKVTLCCYYGSSYYDTAQMSRLIDLAVQECREQGIDTMQPDKLAALVGRWDDDTPNQGA